MLPFGLKLAWFALSLTGVVGCWAVLLLLGSVTGRLWAPVAYAVGATIIEVIFLLGLIWQMQPAKMPVAFCLVQVLGFGSASFFLAGILAALTTGTTLYVAKPKQWSSSDESNALKWRAYYLLPTLVFPLLATTVHVTFVIFFSDFNISGGMVCVPHPLWLRFLSFGGPPLIITIPCLCFTIHSVIRVSQIHQHILRARRSVNFENLDRFTVRPTRSDKSLFKSRSSRFGTPTTSPPTSPRGVAITTLSPSSSVRATTQPRKEAVALDDKLRSFHLPFSGPPHAQGATSSSLDDESFDTVSSVSFAAMATAGNNNLRSTTVQAVKPHSSIAQLFGLYNTEVDGDDVQTPLRSKSPTIQTEPRSESINNSDRISPNELAANMQYQGDLLVSSASGIGDLSSEPFDDIATLPSKAATAYRNPPKLPSLIRSLLAFQLLLVITQLLSVITPLSDIARGGAHGTPAELGTQHFALILVAWAPIFAFGV
ncbi:Fungal-trans domain-containing protein [Mycena indigotica]|uniref:Fungal-trans domain-containing protein n=1 Tax=Mycena indigotica TaxID=2126181 RepID=A0A8H6VR00_9AGAR|nr:Fungal-trans domain-containing protein [Mycena indigotica]KAF7290837.1 Fungal-trans domain-containing protein [Mycena indigotica]